MTPYQAWRDNLKAGYYEILQSLDLLPVLEYMVSKDGLSQRIVAEIKACPSPRDSIAKCVDTILDSTDNCLQIFVDALLECKQEHLAYLITGIGSARIMIKDNKAAITNNRWTLVHNMEPQLVTRSLQSKGVLTSYDVDRVTSIVPKVDQASCLLDTIIKKPNDAFYQLTEALDETEQSHLAALLRSKVSETDLLSGHSETPDSDLRNTFSELKLENTPEKRRQEENEEATPDGATETTRKLVPDPGALDDTVIYGNASNWLVPLRDGGMLLHEGKVMAPDRVRLIDKYGDLDETFFAGNSRWWRIEVVAVLHNQLLAMQQNGIIYHCMLDNLSQTISQYEVEASHISGGDFIDKNNFIFADKGTGCISTYNISTRRQKVVIKGLKKPTSVVCLKRPKDHIFVLTEQDICRVHVYNHEWERLHSMGGKGNKDGQLDSPTNAVVDGERHLLVADRNNHRISKFTLTGEFVRHVLTAHDGLKKPCYVTCLGRYVWIINNDGYKFLRFKYVS